MVLYREIDDESTEDDSSVSLSVTIEEYANEKLHKIDLFLLKSSKFTLKRLLLIGI